MNELPLRDRAPRVMVLGASWRDARRCRSGRGNLWEEGQRYWLSGRLGGALDAEMVFEIDGGEHWSAPPAHEPVSVVFEWCAVMKGAGTMRSYGVMCQDFRVLGFAARGTRCILLRR